jgi:hypothetical protein
MAIGNQASTASLNSTLTQLAVQTRQDMLGWINAFEFVSAMGGASWLEAAPPNGLGWLTGDANAYMAMVTNMWNLASQIYQGVAYNGPALPFNFMGSTQIVWAGQ